MRDGRLATLTGLAAVGSLVAVAAGAAPPLVVACSADPPTARTGEVVVLRVWAPPGATYAWSAPVGRLETAGREARWRLTGVPAGVHATTVQIVSSTGTSAECVTQVVVTGEGYQPRDPLKETGAAVLLPGGREVDGFGLYSYLLLGAAPTDASRARYVEVVAAYARVVPDIRALERYIGRRDLNIAYVPLTAPARADATPEWLLTHYDYPRARSMLRLVGGGREGPYFLSVLRPLTGVATVPRPYLLQDLSSVPPHLVEAWVKEFLTQAAQERFWEERTAYRLALRLRLTVGVLSVGLPQVRDAVDGWITWAK